MRSRVCGYSTLFCQLVLVCIFSATACGQTVSLPNEGSGHFAKPSSQRLVLAHYMPWYTARPFSSQWGWHWTMNHFDPERVVNGKRELASHFCPLIGPYDSGDPHVLEYHLLLMKLAGIDGVIIDWYGREDFRDYSILHRNTQRLVEQVERLGMKVAICYEDQTIPALVKANRLAASQRAAHAVREIDWLSDNWFTLDSYVRLDGRPVLLSFGHAGLTNEEWSDCLGRLKAPVTYFSEHIRREGAAGGFDWPIPKEGVNQVERFTKLSRNWPHSIPVVFPRFVDIYAKAKVSDGYARVEDNDGKTFQTTMEMASESNARLIQIATWNDWGEGTVIEPSREFGYRDLEFVQQMRRKHIDASFQPQAADLQLPHRLWQLRRAGAHNAKQLDDIAESIRSGRLEKARSEIEYVFGR
jgi:hypothetical protein